MSTLELTRLRDRMEILGRNRARVLWYTESELAAEIQAEIRKHRSYAEDYYDEAATLEAALYAFRSERGRIRGAKR